MSDIEVPLLEELLKIEINIESSTMDASTATDDPATLGKRDTCTQTYEPSLFPTEFRPDTEAERVLVTPKLIGSTQIVTVRFVLEVQAIFPLKISSPQTLRLGDFHLNIRAKHRPCYREEKDHQLLIVLYCKRPWEYCEWNVHLRCVKMTLENFMDSDDTITVIQDVANCDKVEFEMISFHIFENPNNGYIDSNDLFTIGMEVFFTKSQT